MARPLRIEYPGAWYHVLNRGGARRAVFRTDDQRRYFLSLLADTSERFSAEWHAYCLMGNHYHLMVRTPEGNLQRIMRHINGLYTQYYNRKQRKDGALFRGRYKAILVDAQVYWLHLSRYIHRNPLQARAVRDLSSYPWSSYRAYVGLDRCPDWLTTDDVLKAIGQRNLRRRYAAYVAGEEADGLAEYRPEGRIAPILGDETFRAKVLANALPDIDRPDLRGARVRPSVEQIVDCVCRALGVEDSEIWTSRRGRGVQNPARALAMYLCQRHGGMTLSQVATIFGLASYASAGASIRNVALRIEGEPRLRRSLNRILLDLTP